ncbi:heme oxygenase-like protein, partial [Phellopilus nigrolimitatus]
LTEHLISKETTKPYSAAVQHPFLLAARSRKLDSSLLALWLSQDRIYAAHAYPRFIGGLIAKIPFAAHHGIRSTQEARNQRVLALLTFSLQNVVREAGFFLNAAEKFGLDLESWKERSATRAYTAELARVANWGSLEEGLIFLWAMEKASSAYTCSWTLTPSSGPHNKSSSQDGNAELAINEFVGNWTNNEFIKFVDDCRVVVDSLGIERGSELWTRAEVIWDRVVELEIDFWPEIGEELLQNSRK